ncbi:MAG: outer membrane beta-barrel protein [Moraxellaceae bacterium]|nr:outer membrane beta-barrel protein [Moraxellaceae bacterium]
MEIMKKLALSSVAVAVALVVQSAAAKVALDPQSIDLEPFLFVPTLEVETKHDSNIYAQPSGKEVDSMVVTVSPTFRLMAQDRENNYHVQYAIAAGIYSEDSNDNYVDHKLDVGAHFEPTSRVRFNVGAGYAMLHDDRGTGASEGKGLAAIKAMSEPDQYKKTGLHGGVQYGAEDAAGQLYFNLGMSQKRYDDSTIAVSRDLDNLNASLGLHLRLMPKTKLLLDIERDEGSYESAATAATSDYEETRLLVGVAWESTAKTSGKVRIGDSKRDLPGRSLSKFTWDLGVQWAPVERSRFSFNGGQRASEGTLPTIAIETTNYSLAWNHDWSERLESRVSVGLTNEDHERQAGTGSRSDDTTVLSANLNYQMRRWLVIGGGVSNRERDSSQPGFAFDRNVISLNALISL